MPLQSVVQLMKENERELLQERRAAERKSFVRPVTIMAGKNRDQKHQAFSKDISPLGIGLISEFEWPENTLASLHIATASGRTLVIKGSVRWTKTYGKGWYLTGWHFISEERV